MLDEPDDNNVVNLFAANEIPADKTFTYKVTRVNDNVVVASGNTTISGGGILKLDAIKLDYHEEPMFIIEWEYDGNRSRNHFIADVRKIDYNKYIDFLNKTGIGHFEGF